MSRAPYPGDTEAPRLSLTPLRAAAVVIAASFLSFGLSIGGGLVQFDDSGLLEPMVSAHAPTEATAKPAEHGPSLVNLILARRLRIHSEEQHRK